MENGPSPSGSTRVPANESFSDALDSALPRSNGSLATSPGTCPLLRASQRPDAAWDPGPVGDATVDSPWTSSTASRRVTPQHDAEVWDSRVAVAAVDESGNYASMANI